MRPVLFSFIACLLLQTAWILATPPFRGIDEFDHAYRADSVAHGYWSAGTQVPDDGGGRLIPVRSSIVEAASSVCAWYAYTGPDNCSAVKELDHGLVSVASSAATYQPVFYWIIGTPALLAEGPWALLIMRATAALLCAFFLAAAVYLLSIGGAMPWLRLGLLTGLTPVLIYSTSLAAPNGLEMLSGVVVWSGLLVLGSGQLDRSHELVVLGWLTVAATLLGTLRQLGPVWLALIFAMCLLVNGVTPYLDLIRRRRIWTSVSAAVISCAVLAGVAWVLSAKSLVLSNDPPDQIDRFGTTVGQFPLWLFQSIAAFPTRNERAPSIVYAIYLLLGLAMALGALRHGRPRQRIAVCAFLVLFFAIPGGITYATVAREGLGWQGRYGLAFTVGFFLLCAAPLARLRSHRLAGVGLIALWLGLTAAHAISVASVYRIELTNDSVVGTSMCPLVGFVPLLLLVVASTMMAAVAALPRPAPTKDFDASAVLTAEDARN
jgi:hypothetical protein